jgi:hypothetical protein
MVEKRDACIERVLKPEGQDRLEGVKLYFVQGSIVVKGPAALRLLVQPCDEDDDDDYYF